MSGDGRLTVRQIGAAVVVTDLIAGVLLNTLWPVYPYTIRVSSFFCRRRLISRVVTLPIYTALIFLLNRAYQMQRKGAVD